jgi:hypothetical protein
MWMVDGGLCREMVVERLCREMVDDSLCREMVVERLCREMVDDSHRTRAETSGCRRQCFVPEGGNLCTDCDPRQ